MRMGRDFLAGSRKHEKLCLDLIVEERGQARSGLREKLQPGLWTVEITAPPEG